MRKLGILFALFCVGTVLSGATLLGYWKLNGTLTPERLGKLFALLRGEELAAVAPTIAAANDKQPAEPPSLDELEQARSLRMRGVEMRELNVASNAELLKSIRDEIDGKIRAHSEAVNVFLAEKRNSQRVEVDRRREQVKLKLELMKPKQAKDQLMTMLEGDSREDAVAIFDMIDSPKQAKIVAEFKTDNEAKILAEVLRIVRKGNYATPTPDPPGIDSPLPNN